MAGTPSESLTSKMELKCLELNDSQLSSGDVSPLCSFLSSKEAAHGIETLILKSRHSSLNRSIISHDGSKGKASNSSSSRNVSAFTGKLMNSIIVFISKSLNLHTVIMDSVRLQADVLASFGDALSSTKSVVRWLSFKSCLIGNMGVKILRPHLSKIQLQVLVFERCGLGDESCTYLSSILKSQEAMLDTLFWNTTLRSDPLAISSAAAAKYTKETNRVLSSGLVAISINGNHVTKKGIDVIRRAISCNHWFLGLNLANNRIEEEGINLLVQSLQDNTALHALLLGGNPGFSTEAACRAAETTSKVPLRLSMMPQGVAMLLNRWMQLQEKERIGDETETYAPSMIDEASRWLSGREAGRGGRDRINNSRHNSTAEGHTTPSSERIRRYGEDHREAPDRSEARNISNDYSSSQDVSGARPQRKYHDDYDAMIASQYDRYTKTRIPGVAGMDFERPHTAAGRSSSYTEGWSRQLKHLVDTSIGRYSPDNSLQGGSILRRSTSPKIVRNQAAACTRLSQGIASIDRVVPIIKAIWSPQRRSHNDFSSNSSRNGGSGGGSGREEMLRTVRSNSSPSSRQRGSDSGDPPYRERTSTTIDSNNNSKMNRSRGINRVNIGGAKARSAAREEDLKGVISLFSDSVSEIRESLGKVTDKLRDITESLSASVLERSQLERSQLERSQYSQNGCTSRSSPIKSPFRGESRSEYGLGLGSDYGAGLVGGPEAPPSLDLMGQQMGQTFGRTRGPLIHHTGTTGAWYEGRGIFDIEQRKQDSGMDTGMGFERDDRRDSSVRTDEGSSIGYNSRKRESAGICRDLENIPTEGRRSPRSPSPVLPVMPVRAVSQLDYGEVSANPTANPLDPNELTTQDMANLIRDRLRKKLKAILRPSSSLSTVSSS